MPTRPPCLSFEGETTMVVPLSMVARLVCVMPTTIATGVEGVQYPRAKAAQGAEGEPRGGNDAGGAGRDEGGAAQVARVTIRVDT